MFDFKPDPSLSPTERYRQLCEAADALTAGERDAVANMANIAALLWDFVPDINWAGFYRVVEKGDGIGDSGGEELVLGPFVGRPACIRIAMGQGVCGTAAATRESQLVTDVHAFPGHIACDGDTRSELVVPVLREGRCIAVIDCDSPTLARFDGGDRIGLEKLAALIAERI